MNSQLELGETVVELVRKDIKHINLRVYPPGGRVRIAAPARMSLDTIRRFATTKLDWIRRHQQKIREQEREPPRAFVTGERHDVFGRLCRLSVVEDDTAPRVELCDDTLILRVRAGSGLETRRAAMDEWERQLVKRTALPLIGKWERPMAVKVERLSVRRMRTRWGSCNYRTRTIRLNAELAKKSEQCLEYVVVHEMVHLLEPTHGVRFVSLMTQFMPEWRFHRTQLHQSVCGA